MLRLKEQPAVPEVLTRDTVWEQLSFPSPVPMATHRLQVICVAHPAR